MQNNYSRGSVLSGTAQHKNESASPHKQIHPPRTRGPSVDHPPFAPMQQTYRKPVGHDPDHVLHPPYPQQRTIPASSVHDAATPPPLPPQPSKLMLKVNTDSHNLNIARSRPMPASRTSASNDALATSSRASGSRPVPPAAQPAPQVPRPPLKMPVPEIPPSVRDQLASEQQRSHDIAFTNPYSTSSYGSGHPSAHAHSSAHTSGSHASGAPVNGSYNNGAYESRVPYPSSDSDVYPPSTPLYSPSSRGPMHAGASGSLSHNTNLHGAASAPPQTSGVPAAMPQFPVAQMAGLTVGQSLSQGLNAFTPKHRRFGSDSGVRASDLTVEQFETIRRYAETQPHDPRAQLELAKRLCEASDHLANKYTDPYHPSTMEVDRQQQERNREAWTSQAMKITKKLATKVHYQEALFFLGSIYSSGKYGAEMDHVKALDYYQKAAKLEHPDACYRVAVCEEFGVGTRPNMEKAVSWYKKAAMLGSVGSMYKLGMLSLLGSMDQPRDFNTGFSWLQRAAEKADNKNPHAVHELALLYERSPLSTYVVGDPIPQNEGKALELFYVAAKLGYAPSQARLGRAFEFGELGCSIEPSWSISWYSQAAHQGDSDAELGMAGWYWTGSPQLKSSYAEAFLWAERAAGQGNPRAMYAVGYFCEVGIGVHRDMNRAKKWYQLAAEKKHPRAAQKLRTLD